jgi:predicted GNAT family N-acyltransferase
VGANGRGENLTPIPEHLASSFVSCTRDCFQKDSVPMAQMEVTPVQSDDEWEQVRSIREQVFIEEQECPPEEEWDGHDATSRHVLGQVDGDAVATARWRTVPHDEEIVAKLERFAVRSDHRGQGYGTQLVQYVLEDARCAGFDTFLVHAQSHLEDWYKDLGFVSTGRTFEEAGIPHVEMVKHG